MKKTNNAKKESSEPVVTIDVQQYLTPATVLAGGIMISLALFFGLRGQGSASINNTAETIILPDTGDNVAAANTNPIATTTIDDDPILGDKSTAKVAIVEFSDYECPFCKRYHQETFDQIVKNFIDTGKAIIVYRDFPLNFHDPLATAQAMAAECVQDLAGDDNYFKYSGLIYETTNSNGQGMQIDTLYDLANSINVDGDKVRSCVESEKFKDEVLNDIADGGAAGVNGTPGFIIGVLNADGTVDGVNVSGAQPYSVFEQVIEEQLERDN